LPARASAIISRASSSVPVIVPSIVIAFNGNIAIGVAKVPSISPVMTTLPPFAMLPVAKAIEPSVPVPRYLKAAALRLEKLRADPQRDRRLEGELRALEQPYRRELGARNGAPSAEFEQFGWLLEELRVSLFAQELRTSVPVSVKRLAKLWQGMRR